jgi:hypothetical protein
MFKQEIDNLVRSPSALVEDIYSLSFSGNPDELGQWRGYADGGFGCCIVTSVVDVYKVADVAGWVIYKPRARATFARKVIDHLR